jgi:hypothetical protein
VVDLDFAVPLCLLRASWRGLCRWYGERASLPTQVRGDPLYRPALRIDWRFVRKLVTFRGTVRPALLAALRASGVRTVTLRSPRELRGFLDSPRFARHSAGSASGSPGRDLSCRSAG